MPMFNFGGTSEPFFYKTRYEGAAKCDYDVGTHCRILFVVESGKRAVDTGNHAFGVDIGLSLMHDGESRVGREAGEGTAHLMVGWHESRDNEDATPIKPQGEFFQLF